MKNQQDERPTRNIRYSTRRDGIENQVRGMFSMRGLDDIEEWARDTEHSRAYQRACNEFDKRAGTLEA